MLYVILYFKLRNFVISQFGIRKYCFGHFLKRIKTRLDAFFINQKTLK
jgi:type IV secretory pathway TrbD component